MKIEILIAATIVLAVFVAVAMRVERWTVGRALRTMVPGVGGSALGLFVIASLPAELRLVGLAGIVVVVVVATIGYGLRRSS